MYKPGDKVTLTGIYCKIAFQSIYGDYYLTSFSDTYYRGEKVTKGSVFAMVNEEGMSSEGLFLKYVS
jgi:hypothetical protein